MKTIEMLIEDLRYNRIHHFSDGTHDYLNPHAHPHFHYLGEDVYNLQGLFSPEVLKNLLSALANNKSLREFTVISARISTYNNPIAKIGRALIALLHENQGIQKIDLLSYYIFDDEAKDSLDFIGCLVGHPTVQSLRLPNEIPNVNLMPALGQMLMAENCVLNTLDITGVPLKVAHAEILARALATNTRLRSLSVHGCRLGEQGILALCEGLEKNTTLESLLIGMNQLTSISMQNLATALQNNIQLKELNLDYNQSVIAGNAQQEGITCLISLLENTPSLINFSWRYMPFYREYFANDPYRNLLKTAQQNKSRFQQEQHQFFRGIYNLSMIRFHTRETQFERFPDSVFYLLCASLIPDYPGDSFIAIKYAAIMIDNISERRNLNPVQTWWHRTIVRERYTSIKGIINAICSLLSFSVSSQKNQFFALLDKYENNEICPYSELDQEQLTILIEPGEIFIPNDYAIYEHNSHGNITEANEHRFRETQRTYAPTRPCGPSFFSMPKKTPMTLALFSGAGSVTCAALAGVGIMMTATIPAAIALAIIAGVMLYIAEKNNLNSKNQLEAQNLEPIPLLSCR